MSPTRTSQLQNTLLTIILAVSGFILLQIFTQNGRVERLEAKVDMLKEIVMDKVAKK